MIAVSMCLKTMTPSISDNQEDHLQSDCSHHRAKAPDDGPVKLSKRLSEDVRRGIFDAAALALPLFQFALVGRNGPKLPCSCALRGYRSTVST